MIFLSVEVNTDESRIDLVLALNDSEVLSFCCENVRNVFIRIVLTSESDGYQSS
jgi:hypothetical protein